MKTQNIGPSHPLFDKNISPMFTQVLVLDEDNNVIKHFKGVMAKVDAWKFIKESN